MPALTPFSTVGPFVRLLVRDRPEGTDCLVTDETRGERITVEGTLTDGDGKPIDDSLIEFWQADADGRYAGDPAFVGFGRVATGASGTFSVTTVKPGRVPVSLGDAADLQAPHILVGVTARGIMSRCWTRVYFEDEAANAADPILRLVPPERRPTLIARRIGDRRYQFDIRIQGDGETVFFDA
jgi:protocatechuate 3,4-dioxygenase, alpha subunit